MKPLKWQLQSYLIGKNNENRDKIEVDRETFVTLAKLASEM